MRHAQTLLVLLAAMVLAALPAVSRAQDGTLPDRVARLSLVQGDVSIAPGGSDGWLNADLNRPLLRGDRLYAGDDSRAVLELGGGALRIAERSAVHLVAMNDDRIQIEVTQGTVNLAVHRLDSGQTWEIDTPTLAFVADRSGSYRIDIDPDSYGAMVTVMSGQGSVYGERSSARQVYSGRRYRFDDSDVDDAQISSVPGYNDFDRFCADLDARYNNSISSRYVADSVIGYSDLDHYGRWEASAEYGHIWFPTQVDAAWAPYRDGRWAWIEPWGWTWVDAAPWGFAPFHYGRWAYVHKRWGWVPGPRLRRAVFAPALVAFVGNVSISIGGGAPVGWFPLGPRDIYQPPYTVTENYFVNINLGSGRFFQRNRMRERWSDYRYQRNPQHFNYAYRHSPQAVTVVSRTDFRDSRLVRRSSTRLDDAVLRQSHIERAPQIEPVHNSRGAGLARVRPEQQAFARPVVVRTAAQPVSPTRQNGLIGPVSAPRGAPRNTADRRVSAPNAMRGRSEPYNRSDSSRDSVSRNAPRTARRASIAAPRGLPEPRAITAPPRTTMHSSDMPNAASSRPQPRSAPRARPRSEPSAPTQVPSRAANLPRSQPQRYQRPASPPPVSHSRARAAAPAVQSAPQRSGTHEPHSATPPAASSPRGRPQHRAVGGIR